MEKYFDRIFNWLSITHLGIKRLLIVGSIIIPLVLVDMTVGGTNPFMTFVIAFLFFKFFFWVCVAIVAWIVKGFIK